MNFFPTYKHSIFLLRKVLYLPCTLQDHILVTSNEDRQKSLLQLWYGVQTSSKGQSVISGCLREVDENCYLLVITQRVVVISYRPCPETSLRNYHYSLHNKLEDCSSQKEIPLESIGFMLKLKSKIWIPRQLLKFKWTWTSEYALIYVILN
jgi:hypothetical protein